MRYWWLLVLLAAATTSAATVEKTIGSGQDYATVTAWEAVSYGATGSDDAVGLLVGSVSDSAVINDSTPLSITLKAQVGQWHDGTPDSGCEIVSDSASSHLLDIYVSMTIEGISFDRNGDDATGHCINVTNAAIDVDIDKCLFYGVTASNTGSPCAIRILSAASTGTIYNCMVCNFSQATNNGAIYGIYNSGTSTWKICNNTVGDFSTGHPGADAYGYVLLDDADTEARNNVGHSMSGSGTQASFYDSAPSNLVHSNNASEDTSSPDASYRSLTITWADEGNDDYHTTDTDLADSGSNDADCPSEDIDYEDRPYNSTNDIGFDESGYPTSVTSTIGTGQTYATPIAWEAADYGTQPTQDAIGQIVGEVVISAANQWSSIHANSITLEPATGDKHQGVPDHAKAARIVQSSANHVIYLYFGGVYNPPITIENIELELATNASRGYINVVNTYDYTIDGVLGWRSVEHTTTTTTYYFYHTGNLTGSIVWKNNLCGPTLHSGTGTAYGFYLNGVAGTGKLMNNTCAGMVSSNASGTMWGVHVADDADWEMRNNLSDCDVTGTGGDYDNSSPSSLVHSNNASVDATSPDSGYRSVTVGYRDSANDDYRLAVTDTDLIGDGLGNGSDADVPTTDCQGDDRGSTTVCDIGWDEYYAATKVSTIGSAKDYATLTAWEAATPPYNSEPSQTAIAAIYGEVADNATLDTEGPVGVILQAGSDIHDGIPNTGDGLVAAATGSVLHFDGVSYDILVQDLEFDGSDGTYNIAGSMVSIRNGAIGTIQRCVLHSWESNRTSQLGLIYTSGGGGGYVYNNICCDSGQAGTGSISGIYLTATGVGVVCNNTCVNLDNSNASGNAYGIRYLDNANEYLKNNLVYDITASGGGTAVDYSDDTATSATTANNISEDATSPDTSYRSKTITFTAAGSSNYHLDIDEIDAGREGVKTRDDANLPTDDIDGETRTPFSNDIGADWMNFLNTPTIGSGKTYATVTAWEAADYGATGDLSQCWGQLYGSVSESPITFNATGARTAKLMPATGEEHDGTPDSGAGVVWDGTGAGPIFWVDTCDGTYIWLDRIEIDGNGGDMGDDLLDMNCDNGAVTRCILHSIARNRAGNRSGLNLGGTGVYIEVKNNLICDIDNAGTGWSYGIFGNGDSTYKIFNNTVVDMDGSNVAAVTVWAYRNNNRSGIEMRNNLAYSITNSGGGGTAEDYSFNTLPTHSHNVSEDATGDLANKTISFVSAGSEDYHLATGETDAIDQGSSDADVPSDDIDAEARPNGSGYDIGFDEWYTPAATGATMPLFYRLYRGHR